MNQIKLMRTMIMMTIAGIFLGGCVGLQSYLLPERNVQKLPVDYQVTASELTSEFLDDLDKARLKYLSDDGESEILEVTGRVSRISESLNGEKVVLLKNDDDKAGVNCTFTHETNHSGNDIEVGDVVAIKGEIVSGAYYDEDLDIFVNASLDKCAVIN
ncbi:MAG: OB-fold protein [Bacteroidales bacterium]